MTHSTPLQALGRRKFLIVSAAAGAAGLLPFRPAWAQEAPPPSASPAPKFAFETVQGIARDLAKQNYSDDPGNLPQSLRDLSYDRYRDIRFKPEQSLWRGE